MKILLPMIASLFCLNACLAQKTTYNCYMISYIDELKTYMTLPITGKTTKQESIDAVNTEIESELHNTNVSISGLETARVSKNAIERPGENVVRYFCFPSDLDEENSPIITEFINSLDSENPPAKITSLFPL